MMTIDLTEKEARMFRKYMEHHDDFQLLYEAGVWDIRSGGAYLNFDADGTLSEIKRNDVLYKRGLPFLRIVKVDL